MAQATSNLLQQFSNPNPTASSILNIPKTTSPVQNALTNVATGSKTSSAPAPLTADQLNAIAKGSGYTGGSFSGTGLASAPSVSNSSLGIGTQNSQSQPSQSPTPANTQPVAPATYPGLISQLANTNTPANNMALSSAGALQNLAGQNPATSGPAFEAYTKAIADQNALKQGIAKQYALNESNAIPLEFQQGRGQVMGRQYASQLDAAQQAVNQQQAGLGYQISGQQTQNSGLSAAGSLANSTQGLQQGALGTAAGLAAPRQQGYVMLDPQTGQPIGGVGGANAAIAQGAQYGALESGVGQSALDTQAINGAQNGINSITQLINSANLNPNSVNLANEGIQTIQKNLSNSDYQTLLNSLNAINASLSKVTGTPVDIAALSSSQGTSLLATINNQVQIAKGIASAKAVPQGGSTGGSTSSSGGLFSW